MTRDEVLKLCEIVGSHPEEFLLEIGCRKRTTSIPLLPRKNKDKVVIPYGNKIPIAIPAVLNTQMSLIEIIRLVRPGLERPENANQLVYQYIYWLSRDNKVKRLEDNELNRPTYIWVAPKPKTRLKVLEIPRDSADKLLVLGM